MYSEHRREHEPRPTRIVRWTDYRTPNSRIGFVADNPVGHLGAMGRQVGSKLLHRAALVRAAPEKQDRIGPAQRLGNGLVEVLPLGLPLAVCPLVGRVEVPIVPVRVVGLEPLGRAPRTVVR